MAGYDRNRINLGRRTQQQTDTRDNNGGVGRQGFMNYSQCGLKFFKLGEVGSYHDLNILPWTIGSKKHPEVAAGNMDVGDPDYVLDIMVHTRIGPGEGDYVCPKKNYNKPCPICERADELWKNEATKDDARKLFARRKCVYLVQELTETFHAKDKTQKPLIFETAHATFSKELQSRATSCLRGKGVVNFADPNDAGKVVSFSVNEGTMGNGKKFKEAGNFEFNERVEEISDEILDNCPSLDSMLVVKSYDQLKAALYGDPESTDEDFENQQDPDAEQGDEQGTPARFRDNTPARFEEEPAEENPAPRRRAAAPVEEEDAPAPRRRAAAPADEAPADEAPAPRRRRPAEEPAEETPAPRRRAAAEPQDEAPAPRRRAAAPAEEDAPAENAYQEARRSARRATSVDEAPAPRKTTPVAENPNAMPFDEDEQPEETPAETPKATRGAADDECPNGYQFGRDCDVMPLCSKCNDNIWAKCSECKRKMRK